MFRRSIRRLGHQLIKEPMGHEENTFSRGRRTQANALQHVYGVAAVTAAGCILALYSFVAAHRRVHMTITPSGKMVKDTPRAAWWNF